MEVPLMAPGIVKMLRYVYYIMLYNQYNAALYTQKILISDERQSCLLDHIEHYHCQEEALQLIYILLLLRRFSVNYSVHTGICNTPTVSSTRLKTLCVT